MQRLSPLALATVRAMTPQIAGLPALPEMGCSRIARKAEPDPVAALLADILLQAAVESPTRKCAGAARERPAERSLMRAPRRRAAQWRFFALLAKGLSEVRKAMRIGTPGMSKASPLCYQHA
ncbi:MAG: hypothetical protein E5W81_17650 [Mesorhizobium sp.]|nr:MAG: hypothetical protein E5W81_17650 [Mesorhizobium sp.]